MDIYLLISIIPIFFLAIIVLVSLLSHLDKNTGDTDTVDLDPYGNDPFAVLIAAAEELNKDN